MALQEVRSEINGSSVHPETLSLCFYLQFFTLQSEIKWTIHTSCVCWRGRTFINGWNAFAHPAAAAPELNPQLTVSRDDWIRKRVSTETACRRTRGNDDTACQSLLCMKLYQVNGGEDLHLSVEPSSRTRLGPPRGRTNTGDSWRDPWRWNSEQSVRKVREEETGGGWVFTRHWEEMWHFKPDVETKSHCRLVVLCEATVVEASNSNQCYLHVYFCTAVQLYMQIGWKIDLLTNAPYW